jgi:hypothetical protein
VIREERRDWREDGREKIERSVVYEILVGYKILLNSR